MNGVGESLRQAARKRLYEHFYGLSQGPDELAKSLRTELRTGASASRDSVISLVSKLNERGLLSSDEAAELIKAKYQSHQMYLEKLGTEEQLVKKFTENTRRLAINMANKKLKHSQRKEIGSRITSELISKYLRIYDEKATSPAYLHQRNSHLYSEKNQIPLRFIEAIKLYGRESIEISLNEINIEKEILEAFKNINPFSDFFPHVHKLQTEPLPIRKSRLGMFQIFLNNIELPRGTNLDLIVLKSKKNPENEMIVQHKLFDHWYPKAEGIARLELVHHDSRLKGTPFELLCDEEIRIINSNVKALYERLDLLLNLAKIKAINDAEIRSNPIRNYANVLWRILEIIKKRYA